MRCPTLNELPSSISGKTGWPWTKESAQLPDTMRDGSPWPKLSIVTPSYNQAQFLEETIRSVLLQGYPNLEYLVIDGGSTDGSVDIIQKYEPWLSFWVSESDRGQSHAINKGFKLVCGDIVAWLNSDDTYRPGVLHQVAQFMSENSSLQMVYGDVQWVGEQNIKTVYGQPFDLESYLEKWYICQPASFQRRETLEKGNTLDEGLHYVMDIDWWLRIFATQYPTYIPSCFANFREWHGSKTYDPPAPAFFAEIRLVTERFFARQAQVESTFSLRNRVLARQSVACAIMCMEQDRFADGGDAFVQAAKHDPEVFSIKTACVYDALIFAACGSEARSIDDSRAALRRFCDPLISADCMNKSRYKNLLNRLQIVKAAQIGHSDALRAGRRSLFSQLISINCMNYTWLWKQKGWVKRLL